MNTAIVLLVAILHLCNGEIILNVKGKRSIRDDPTNNIYGIVEKGYYVQAYVGTPPQLLNILIDTGSSNFAIASQPHPLIDKYFDGSKSSSLKRTGVDDVSIEYTEGFWKGSLITDLVSIPSANLKDPVRVSFVEIAESKKFFINESGWQGILGMAYDEIIRPAGSKVKSFSSIVLGHNGIRNVFGLKLCMPDIINFDNRVSGSFILGGYDRSLDINSIYWTPIVREWYYDVLIIGAKVGNNTLSFQCAEFNNGTTIVDSGTTNLKFPTAIFNQVVDIMKDYAVTQVPSIKIPELFWKGSEDLCWNFTLNPYILFPVVTIYLPSSELNHTITLQVFPEHYILYKGNSTRTSQPMACYKFGISSSDTGSVLGSVVMEQYYVIFDRANKRIGFAYSDCSQYSRLGYIPEYVNTTDCSYSPVSTISSLQIVMYILLAVIGLCMLPVCFIACVWCSKMKRLQSHDDSDHLLDLPSSN